MSEIDDIRALKERLAKANQTIAELRDQISSDATTPNIDRYALAFSATNDGIWDHNLLTGDVQRSPRVYEILGMETDSVGASSDAFSELVHPDDNARREQALKDHLESGTPFNEEYRIRHQSGEYLWIHAKAQAAWDQNGKPVRIAGAFNEITERKQAEIALQESEQRFRALIEGSGLGIHLSRVSGGRLLITAPLLKLLGYATATEIDAVPQYQLIAANDREKAAHFRKLAIENPDEPIEYDCDFIGKGGRAIPVHVILRKILWNGEDAIQSTIIDLSRRKKAEQAHIDIERRFRAIIDNTPSLIYLKDTNSRLLLVNKTYERIADNFEENLVSGEKQDWLKKETLDQLKALDARVLATGEPVESEYDYFDSDGTTRIMKSVKFPIKDPDRGIIGIGGISTDMTLERMAADALQNAKVTAESAARLARESSFAKSNFLANMSHELRTPLNAIIGFSEAIHREEFGAVGVPKYVEYANDISDAGKHLLSIINDILDLSKIETGKMALYESTIDISEVVSGCLLLVKDRAIANDVAMNIDIVENLAPLFADEKMLKQVLINILSNAIKFTPDGGDVRLNIWSQPDTGCVFQITDTGIGIALEDIPVALSPFDQIDSDLNRSFDGTGLGLSLSKSLVELHGGSLDLQSELDVGTTVTFRLPAKRIVTEQAIAS
jgi:PAS domain S-box-containing protein